MFAIYDTKSRTKIVGWILSLIPKGQIRLKIIILELNILSSFIFPIENKQGLKICDSNINSTISDEANKIHC